MRTEGMRQSDRVTLRLEVEASWFNGDGVAVTKPAESLLVSRNGGVIRLQEKLFTGQELTLRRTLEGDTVKTALARLLMECSFCQRREVVYLNEMELKSFEVRRCAARLCKHCDAPSIWVEAQSDV